MEFLKNLLFLFILHEFLIFNCVFTVQPRQSVIRKFNQCRTQSKATKDDVVTFNRQEIPTTATGKCLLACMFESSGMMKAGKFNFNGALALAQNAYKQNRDKVQKAKQLLQTCGRQVNSETNKCQLASKLAICATDLSDKMKL